MTPRRRKVHVASERLALLVGVPFLIWASFQTPVAAARIGLRIFAATSLLVDGWLLSRWRKRNDR
ncbi:hypothetical protein LCGC14_0754600 [marine sediment metagenome]|uniref:Uncharacterized protein n=1 Tax=marine sediment metagenome TaxID=412755 RepID=A0A0F9Q310_9ZZZZ